MRQPYRRAPSRSTATIPNPRAARLHRIRQEIRTGASAALDACQMVQGNDFILAAMLVDAAERLLNRLAKLERRAAS